MLIEAANLAAVTEQATQLVGFWGAPPREILTKQAERFGAKLVDLDVYLGAPSTGLVPDTYCHIIRNCVDNAVALAQNLRCIVAATGKEKCDAGRFAAWLLNRTTKIPILETENTGATAVQPPVLCQARGPLKKRVIRIMQSIVEPLDAVELTRATSLACRPTHGFWGTPPHPIELLDLFPETTHVFGWTRAVEQGRPADLALETTVPDDLPIVFFSQGFCAKAALARQLAEQKRGMHVDVHDALNAATQAKIEAFIRLSDGGAR